MRLGTDGLGSLDGRVGRPTYDRDGLTAGIVHVGVGGFHRAHEAHYVDRLLEAGLARDWAICGVGLLPHDRRMRDVLERQDHLYTLVERDSEGVPEARVVGSLVDYLFAPDDPEAVIERMAAPETRIISLTITEGGYNLRGGSGAFDVDDPAVRRDLEPGRTPSTVFGLVAEALQRRRLRGTGPVTILSCDNLEENGEVARRAFTGYAELLDPALAAWMAEQVSFPSSMVDRITPVTTAADRAFVAETFGIEDEWPVVCEPYVQWVLEDRFAAGRPPWEQVGVQLVPDVRPYEKMKLRLLNASHQVMSYLGALAGFAYVHEVCRDPGFEGLLRGYLAQEAAPTLDPVPGVDLGDYQDALLHRFRNAAIADTLARQCVDASERLPKFLVPVLRDQLRSGGPIERSALVLASWARYAEGVDDAGRPLELVDVRRAEIEAAVAGQREDPTAALRLAVFDGLRDEERFVSAYVASLSALHQHGARAVVDGLPA